MLVAESCGCGKALRRPIQLHQRNIELASESSELLDLSMQARTTLATTSTLRTLHGTCIFHLLNFTSVFLCLVFLNYLFDDFCWIPLSHLQGVKNGPPLPPCPP